MTQLNNHHRSLTARAHWAWLIPILALAPLSLAAKGCSNSGVVGDDCPTAADCPTGTAGSSNQAGTGNQAGSTAQAGSSQAGTRNQPSSGKDCGGQLGLKCAESEFCAYAADATCGAADQTGTCQARPGVCADIYSPVCGCDDKTYGNECEANGAGVSVARQGECGSPDPNPGDSVCSLNTACKDGEYCNFPPDAVCGAADQTGTCEARPDACTKEYVPVCGCDGVTYGNKCEAARAGTSIASEGACSKEPGETCGGKTNPPNAMCGTDQYCAYPPEAQCGRFDAPGKCVDIPKGGACDAVYDPVCGCDGMTYGNSCSANLAGVSIDYEGECVCGGLAGIQCREPAQFCYHAIAMCGGDQQGTCRVKPMVCTDDVNPVCGCDQKTYSNACQAAAAGVSVLAEGACK